MGLRVGVIDGAGSRELRRRVLRPHLGRSDTLPGDDVAEGVHIGAVGDDGSVLSTCFLRPAPCYWRQDVIGRRAWRLMQMATVPESRGQGLGGLVVDAAVEHLMTIGIALVWCHAREPAVAFYERHGFQVHGEVFVEFPVPGQPVPHLRMWRELPVRSTSSG